MSDELNKSGCCGGGCCDHGHDAENKTEIEIMAEESKESKDSGCCGGGCCDHGHDHEDDHEHGIENMVVDLEDENGNIITCPIVDAFEFEENEYVLAQEEETEAVYLFRVKEDGELEVPEEDEFTKVSDYYSNVLAEE